MSGGLDSTMVPSAEDGGEAVPDAADLIRHFRDIENRLQRLESAVFPPAPDDIKERARWIADQLDEHLAKKKGRPHWEPHVNSNISVAFQHLQRRLRSEGNASLRDLSLGPETPDEGVERVIREMRAMSATGSDLNPTDWTILRKLAERGEGAYASLKELLSSLARKGISASDGTLRSRLPALVKRGYLSKRKRGKGGGGYCMTPKAWWTLRAAAARSIKTK